MAVPFPQNAGSTMRDRELYSIDAREILGGITRNTISSALRRGELSSVVIACRRCIAAAAIEEFIQASTSCVSRSVAGVREPRRRQLVAPPIRARASPRAAERGHFAILPLPLPLPPSPPPNQKR